VSTASLSISILSGNTKDCSTHIDLPPLSSYTYFHFHSNLSMNSIGKYPVITLVHGAHYRKDSELGPWVCGTIKDEGNGV